MSQQPPFHTLGLVAQQQGPFQPERAQSRKRTMNGWTIGCLIVPLSLVLDFGGLYLFTTYWNQHLFQSQTVVNGFMAALIGSAGISAGSFVVGLILLARKKKRAWIPVVFPIVVELLVLPYLLSAYGLLPSHVGMTRTGFLLTSATPDTNGRVSFYNPPDGVTQVLCVGVDQHCHPGAGNPNLDPPQLDRGLVIHPGQTVSVDFIYAEIYQITSETTPHMNITVDNTFSDNSD